MLDRFGGRKLLGVLSVVAAGLAYEAMSKTGLTAEMVELLEYAILALVGGNGIEHLAGALRGRNGAAVVQTSNAPDPRILAALQAGAKDQAEIKEALTATGSGVAYLIKYVQQNDAEKGS